MKKQNKNKIKRSTTRLVALGFALIIVIGTMLLSLPISVRSGQPNIMNALFTATSATCVTGLIVADTYQNWTTFGIIVIFTLIQIGGLGFMTIGVYISIILKKKIGLKQRENLQDNRDIDTYRHKSQSAYLNQRENHDNSKRSPVLICVCYDQPCHTSR